MIVFPKVIDYRLVSSCHPASFAEECKQALADGFLMFEDLQATPNMGNPPAYPVTYTREFVKLDRTASQPEPNTVKH
jgi:hypothetical protein